MKGQYAKNAIQTYLSDGLIAACLAAHKPFLWIHPSWQPSEATGSKIMAKRSDKHGASTLRWLALSVAPALKKAHKEGLIVLDDWIDEYLKD